MKAKENIDNFNIVYPSNCSEDQKNKIDLLIKSKIEIKLQKAIYAYTSIIKDITNSAFDFNRTYEIEGINIITCTFNKTDFLPEITTRILINEFNKLNYKMKIFNDDVIMSLVFYINLL
jgi:hypothetical protein